MKQSNVPAIKSLDRSVLIHVCKDKTLSYRRRHEPIFNGVALPVFSVNDEQEAERLLLFVGRKQYQPHPQMPGRPWLKVTLDGELDFKRHLTLDDLPAVKTKLEKAYTTLYKG